MERSTPEPAPNGSAQPRTSQPTARDRLASLQGDPPRYWSPAAEGPMPLSEALAARRHANRPWWRRATQSIEERIPHTVRGRWTLSLPAATAVALVAITAAGVGGWYLTRSQGTVVDVGGAGGGGGGGNAGEAAATSDDDGHATTSTDGSEKTLGAGRDAACRSQRAGEGPSAAPARWAGDAMRPVPIAWRNAEAPTLVADAAAGRLVATVAGAGAGAVGSAADDASAGPAASASTAVYRLMADRAIGSDAKGAAVAARPMPAAANAAVDQLTATRVLGSRAKTPSVSSAKTAEATMDWPRTELGVGPGPASAGVAKHLADGEVGPRHGGAERYLADGEVESGPVRGRAAGLVAESGPVRGRAAGLLAESEVVRVSMSPSSANHPVDRRLVGLSNAGHAEHPIPIPPPTTPLARWHRAPITHRYARAMAGHRPCPPHSAAATSPPHSAAASSPALSPAVAGAASVGAVVVDVEGKVAHPGVQTLSAGSRVYEALAAAGGALPGVDVTALDLARPVADGEQLRVGIAGAPTPVVGLPQPTGGAVRGKRGKAGQPVNLNTATLEQLETVPDVGPALAQRILDWRTEHGRFASVAQLREVRGIGERKFADMQNSVTV